MRRPSRPAWCSTTSGTDLSADYGPVRIRPACRARIISIRAVSTMVSATIFRGCSGSGHRPQHLSRRQHRSLKPERRQQTAGRRRAGRLHAVMVEACPCRHQRRAAKQGVLRPEGARRHLHRSVSRHLVAIGVRHSPASDKIIAPGFTIRKLCWTHLALAG